MSDLKKKRAFTAAPRTVTHTGGNVAEGAKLSALETGKQETDDDAVRGIRPCSWARLNPRTPPPPNAICRRCAPYQNSTAFLSSKTNAKIYVGPQKTVSRQSDPEGGQREASHFLIPALSQSSTSQTARAGIRDTRIKGTRQGPDTHSTHAVNSHLTREPSAVQGQRAVPSTPGAGRTGWPRARNGAAPPPCSAGESQCTMDQT